MEKVKLNYNGYFLYSMMVENASSTWMMMKEEDGSQYNIMYARAYTFLRKAEVRVGSDDTPPSLTDYCLGSQINTLTKVSDSTTPVWDDTGNKAYGYYTSVGSFSVTYRNDTANDITVKEIGVFYFNGQPVTSYGDDKWIMFARGVLDAPVTIEPNKTYTFTLTID